MSSDPENANSVPKPAVYSLAGRRRREAKDTLLADEPPRGLGIGIGIVAVLLGAAVYFGWSFQYEETVPLGMVIQTDAASHQVYGTAYVQPQEMAQVKSGQPVEIELASYPAGSYGWLKGTVGGGFTETNEGLYLVRVDLGLEPVTSTGFHPAFNKTHQAQGKIVVEKVRMFSRLFSLIRTIFHRG
jgi:hypothetical protein